MPPESADLRVVLGSTTPPGRLHRALDAAIALARDRGSTADLLDLAGLDLGFADGTPAGDLADDTARAIDALDSATSLILATPVYRGSMTGSLKNLLDLTPVAALQGKVIGLVAMGASDHHFLGAERHLRDVLAFFGAVVMPVAVYLNSADFTDGVLSKRAETALDQLFAGSVVASNALAGTVITQPAPLAARAVQARPAVETK